MDAAPAVSVTPRSSPQVTAALNRVVAGIVLIATVSLLGVAAWLTPDPHGTGTHTQLGLPPCGLMMTTGLPCTTCGMTTAFAYAADGDLISAFRTQPAGTLLAILTAMTAIVSAWALWTGSSFGPIGAALWRPSIVIPAIVIVLLSWAYTMGLALLTPGYAP